MAPITHGRGRERGAMLAVAGTGSVHAWHAHAECAPMADAQREIGASIPRCRTYAVSRAKRGVETTCVHPGLDPGKGCAFHGPVVFVCSDLKMLPCSRLLRHANQQLFYFSFF